ncbi:MAG: serine/threonine protein kinase [Kiritimatiellae bacterium]|nr:serine/threonine protein kinase [Kiritimatiellia bacterium]
MVHRDIKPANILYNAAGVCKLTDFGIAKSSRNEETQLTLREAVFGTPAYMSPEQARDARMVDARSDIYSLGTVFFELLSGERPYQGESPVQVLAQVITDKPPPDVRSKPKARKIHSDTAKLVASMMAKDPADRPQTPQELLERLRKLKAHVPYAEPEESASEPVYDDSTIMDPTNPPPTDPMYAGFPSDSGTVRAPTGGAGHTGVWDGAPTGGGTAGGGTGGGGTDPRTAVSLPTFSTQAVKDGTVGTVATVGTRFGETVVRPAAPAKKRGGGKSAAGKVWFAVAMVVLLGLSGAFWWAAEHDWFAEHGILQDVFGPGGNDDPLRRKPMELATLVFLNPNSTTVFVRTEGGLEDGFAVESNGEAIRSVQAGMETTIRYHAPYSGLFREHDEKDAKLLTIAVEEGRTEEIALELTAVEGAALESATLRFHNPYDVQVHVETEGGLVDSFDVDAGKTEEKTAKAGEQTTARWHARFTTLYKETRLENARQAVCRPKAGEPEDVELVLTPAEGTTLQQAILRFHNPYETPVRVETTGGLSDRFEVGAKATVERSVQAGVATTVRYHAPFSGLYAETDENPKVDKQSPATGTEVYVELTLTPKIQTDGGRATLYFRNPGDTPVLVVATGGLSDRFEVNPGATVERSAQAGAETGIQYHAPYSGLYAETADKPKSVKVKPAADEKKAVELTLTPKAPSSDRQVTLRFHNPLDTAVLVEASGGLSDRFEVAPKGTETRFAQVGKATAIRYQVPFSGLYETGETNVAGSAAIELALARKTLPDAQAVLLLSNPNDVDVGIQLSGGREDEIWLKPGEKNSVGVRSGVETVVRCHANNRQYAENSPETAKTSKVNPKGGEQIPVDLTLTKRAYPVVQLVNGGDVALAVRVNGETFTLSAGGSKATQMPANRKVQLEWEVAEEGYLEGGREIGPYDWNARNRVTIVPERQAPPSIRVRNVSRRAMAVTVTRSSDGTPVEAPFRLAGGSEKTVEVPGTGAYRVQTKAVPDKRNDADQNPDHYDATDRVLECGWGKTAHVECTADLKQNPGDGSPVPDQGDWVRDALVSKLTAAKMKVDEKWVEHSINGAVTDIANSLKAAWNFARYVDADGIAGDDIPYRGWAESVAAKRGVRNAEWQGIVEATEASGNWSEFFNRFQGQRH